MQRALSEFQVAGHGVRTTIPFHQRVLSHPVFQRGDVFTDFVERHMFEKVAA
jgi:acetyl-CoA carboxylase biotin carboxylase subunit